jgi:hypothetical protein
MIKPQVGNNIKQSFQIYLPLMHYANQAETTPSHDVYSAGAQQRLIAGFIVGVLSKYTIFLL